LFGERAIRRGNYKAILVPNESNTAKWELYDLSRDKGESINLAHEQEDVLKELVEAWFTYEAETGVIVAEDGWAVRMSPDLITSKRIQNIVARIRYWLVPHDEI
jgi:arylsulfatase A-like enzyme